MWIKNYTHELFLLAMLALCCMVLSFYVPVFATGANISQIFLATSIVGILSLSAVLVISAGVIDLSVGSLMALSLSFGFVLLPLGDLPVFSFLMLALLSGTLCGLINGILVGYFRLPAFLVTLATLSLGRGLSLAFMNGRAAYNILPDQVIWLGQGYIAGVIPVPVVVWLVCAVVIYIILYHTKFGAHNLALGDNAVSATKMGVPYMRHFIGLFALSGFFTSVAGIIFVARVNAVDPSSGLGYELLAITAAILGGTQLSGGKGSVIGCVLGAIFMGVIQNGLNLLNVPAYYQQIMVGVVLLLLVLFLKKRA